MRWPVILALAVLLMASPVLADITGPARVIDGDTLDVAGERIRLHGIDAPESGQTCVADGERWRCGQRATDALTNFIGSSPVRCEGRGTDRYGRTIAACTVRGEDVEAWMVTNGWALAYRRYSLDYTGELVMPSLTPQFRARRNRSPADAAPSRASLTPQSRASRN